MAVAAIIGVIPKVVWSADSFGCSSSMAYLFKLAGADKAVISRVDIDINAFMRQTKLAPFTWRQLWGINYFIISDTHFSISFDDGCLKHCQIHRCGRQDGRDNIFVAQWSL